MGDLPPCQGVGPGWPGPSMGSACPQPQSPGPGSGPPPFLASSLLQALCSRSGAERPPPSPLLSSLPFKPCTKAAPRPPTAHSPQAALPAGPRLALSCPRRGGPPPTAQTAACQPAPQAWLWSGLPAPPRGARGHFKGERTALPPSLNPEWGLSQAKTARPATPLCGFPFQSRLGPPPGPSRPGWGAFFLLSLDV